jgi:hypothetical protein
MRPRVGGLLVIACSLLLFRPVAAAQNVSIRDVPLKPWTYFARNWDWTYDALEKLALSGITGKVVLNTKPMSRREMALIVADMVQRIQNNQVSGFDSRTDLQGILLDLLDEFSPELLALGMTGYGIKGEPPRTLEIKPIDHLQIRAGYTGQATDLEYSNGERLDRGMNGRVTGDSWLEAGGVLAAYAQPEYLIGPDTNTGRLVEGYAKGRVGPLELVVGREPLWWGPGFHGSMLFSNNALGLDMVRLQTANQIYLPWVFEELGPVRFQLFFGQLEAERQFFPRSKVTGGRLDFTPAPWIEVGFARSIVFDGTGRPHLPWYKYPAVWFHGNRAGTEGDPAAGDNRFQADVTLRLADVGKYIALTRDAELYLDFGWDDTCCGSTVTPIKPGEIIGVYLPNLFNSPDTTFRAEYAWTSSFQFTHSVWQDGFLRKGHVISDFIGTHGEDLYFRLTQRLDPKLDIGMELDFARRGRTQIGQDFSTKELHRYFGVDLSYKHSDGLSLNLGARLEWVKNRDFVQGKGDINQVYTASVTYTFAPAIGAGNRARLAPGTLPPLAPPPKAPDPDQILSWAYAGKVAKDSWSVLTSPFRWDATNWLIAGGVVAATGGAMLLDHGVRDLTQDNRSRAGSRLAQNVSDFGLIAPAVGLGVSYIAGEVFHNQEAKQRAADGVEASLINNLLIVYPMKFLLGRGRPSSGRGSQDYRPFNISGSMPSFHTAEAFTTAAVIAAHADTPWVSAAVYSLAAGVGLSRIYVDKHWTSDVILSAAIGSVVGKAVVALNRERRSSNIAMIPLTGKQMWGAALQVKY